MRHSQQWNVDIYLLTGKFTFRLRQHSNIMITALPWPATAIQNTIRLNHWGFKSSLTSNWRWCNGTQLLDSRLVTSEQSCIPILKSVVSYVIQILRLFYHICFMALYTTVIIHCRNVIISSHTELNDNMTTLTIMTMIMFLPQSY